MSLSHALVKILSRKFEPFATTLFRFRGNDVVVHADTEGIAVRAFIGKANENGFAKGERYSRVRKHDRAGDLVKDHWERKGAAS